jgi:glyoxylase-like metal-dependent hydrolase (beta-lactamase superfamily II)
LDAGEPDDLHYITRLDEVLKEENIDLEHIVVTHWHHDHIGGVHNVVNRVHSGKFVVKFVTDHYTEP